MLLGFLATAPNDAGNKIEGRSERETAARKTVREEQRSLCHFKIGMFPVL